MSRVLILGAGGGMGRRIAALWPAEAPVVPLRLAARRLQSLEDLAPACPAEKIAACLEDPASLRAAVTDVAVVINAVGPFDYDPVPLLEVCEAAGAHYVDLAGESQFYAAVRSWAERAGRRIAVSPGASTISGLVEIAAGHLAERIGALPAAFDVFLSLGSANPLTPGLLASMTLPLGAPLRSPGRGCYYRELRARTLYRLGGRLFGRYPAPFDEAGLPVGGQRVCSRFWVGLDRSWMVHALRVFSYARPHFSSRAWTGLARAALPLASLARLVGGAAGGLRVEALDAGGELLAAAGVLAAREGLNVPALPSVWAARALLRGAGPGYRPLRQLIGFEAAVASLRAHGFEVEVGS